MVNRNQLGLRVACALLMAFTPGCKGEEHSFLSKAEFDEKYGRSAEGGSMEPMPQDDTPDIGAGGTAGGGGTPASGGSGPSPLPRDAGEDPPDGGPALGVELCTNGVDDNGDSLVDCADPACGAGYRCVPAPPAGFSEVFALSTVGPGLSPTCGGSYTVPQMSGLYQEPAAAPAACDCQCSPNSEVCRVAMDFYEGSQCQGTSWPLTGADRLRSGRCEDVYFSKLGTPGSESLRASVQAPANTNGRCTATNVTLPEVAWAVTGRGCAPDPTSAAGCTAGSCLPNPPQSLGPLCVSQAGDVVCPAAFPTKRLFYTDVVDTRACECGCSVTCPTHTTGYTGDTCTLDPNVAATTIALDNSCVPLPLDPSPSGPSSFADETRSFQTPPATCPAVVQTSGNVTPSGAVTICCE